mmetsp:Transcript_4746/g.10108  ORF Transcript_4746/g.10108 Transcript_4746/m.10108 type:complete len:80 (-) Transcript_4746:375-614(-)
MSPRAFISSPVLGVFTMRPKWMLIISLSVDLRPDVVGDGLGDSDRQVSLGIFDNVVDQLRVFQHGVAIGNEGQIGGVVL